MEGNIEVGDVFTLREGAFREYICTNSTEHFVDAKDGAFSRERCRLVRKADPYHGISLPSPPDGYRLAKWGEEYDNEDGSVLWWMDGKKWVPFRTAKLGCKDPRNLHYDTRNVESAIFAIPLDQPSPIKSWQFRESPWVAPEPKTLADVPDDVDVIVAAVDFRNGAHIVMHRRGTKAYYRTLAGETLSLNEPKGWKFVRYLDPPPQKPLSFDDVPDGRVIQFAARGSWWFRVDQVWRRLWLGDIGPVVPPQSEFTITNHVAEFK